MNDATVSTMHFTNFNLTKLAQETAHSFNAAILMRSSKVQILAKKDIHERWKLTEISSAEFLRKVDTNLTYYSHVEANSKNKSLFIHSAIDTMDLMPSKIIDLKSKTIQSAIARFDGTIDNKTGSFLIEFPLDVVNKYVYSVQSMKAVNIYEKLSLNHLLDFYANEMNSPLKQFDLNKLRYIYLPRTQDKNEYSK